MTSTTPFHGPIRAAILDWSGTLVDPYSLAPTDAFLKLFQRYGISLTVSEIREFVGNRKDVHVNKLLALSRVKSEWMELYRDFPTSEDSRRMYEELVDLQKNTAKTYSQLVPGALEAIEKLKRKQIRIGVTTGYPRSVVEAFIGEVEAQGLKIDISVAGDDVLCGSRPRPFMIFRAMEKMDAWPVQGIIKLDDTPAGVQEGLAAGCWSVGVARFSNCMGVETKEEGEALKGSELESRLQGSRDQLWKAGAHFVIDDLSTLPDLVEEINNNLRNGKLPFNFKA